MNERSATVGDLEIRYIERSGENGNLLILHGWCHSKERWLSVLPLLDKKYRIILPDLPGFGNSGKPEIEYSLDYYSKVIQSFCVEIGIDIPAAVIAGHSLGGDIALSISRENEIGKLILVSTPLLPVWQGTVAKRLGLFSRLVFGVVRKNEFLKRQAARFTVADPKYIDRLMLEDPEKPTVSSAISALKNLADVDFTGDVNSSNRDILCIHGEKDKIVSFKQYRHLHPRVKVLSIPGVGHSPFLENPELFAEKVNIFLGK